MQKKLHIKVGDTVKVLSGDGTQCFIDKDGGYMLVSRLYNNIFAGVSFVPLPNTEVP